MENVPLSREHLPKEHVEALARRAKVASRALGITPTRQRDRALQDLIRRLNEDASDVLDANQKDVAAAEQRGTRGALLDRLRLTPARLRDMAEGVKEIIGLTDPVGEVVRGWTPHSGIQIQEVRVPLGVVGVIYESRPNVTIDVTALCLKSANAVVLKGGSDALHSNRMLISLVHQSLEQVGLPVDAVQLLDTPDREAVRILLQQEDFIDVIIPRGGESLIREVVNTSRIPVIKQYKGVCHIYVAPDADIEAAIPLILNAKCQRPGTCNALETLLVDAALAPVFLPRMGQALVQQGVEIRGCEVTQSLFPGTLPAQAADWDTEYLDLILSVRVVEGLDAAIAHINAHGSGHSEAILTSNLKAANRFQQEVDAACVYVNASTRLTDGGQFGFGAEVGISTGKLHSRGPMGIRDLTTRKYLVQGDYTLRA